jgi:hypothetical protein
MAEDPESTGRGTWQRLAFASLGAMVGAAYGYGASVATTSGSLASWIVVILGIAIFGWIGFKLADSPEYSTFQKLILLSLVPPVFVASVAGVLLMLGVLVIVSPVFLVQGIRRDRRFRAQMRAAGRYFTWQELLPSLESGTGTLIEESYGTGPFRIWYTPDDVPAKGEPISTNEEILGVLSGKISHVFNSRCLREYLDPANGSASLTNIRPARVRTGRFQKKFPQMKIVRLIHRPEQMDEPEE